MEETDRSGVLAPSQVTATIAERGLRWSLQDQSLTKTVRGRDFSSALDFVNRLGALAEEKNHHPDIAISWNTVTLSLRTHSAGGITSADLELAGLIDRLDPPAT